ncbi:12553_t:CDS:1 [Entrophospora sp. SA101]|nr:3554_t:CDS:1 [Entrophospora sp. SA101]CAJ0642388.1 4719_t:CDS:1 [Entrophospora sp. SA101]CAJ0752227.1 12553_t:CDS:1 [Entrophospora sp. SA101]CAJ0824759.1 9149_t:CDS:1 [Entrophospora sp. SA101]CAJ0824860.1 15582_t:CDS:1 [Entrophospora sp. SA101]
MADSFIKREFAPKRLSFWIFWFSSHIGLFFYGFYKQKNDPELAHLNAIGFSVWTSRGAGLCLAYDGALILLPVCRNIIKYLRLTPLLKWIIPFDENLWFHRQCAYSMLFWTLVHTFAHYINFIILEKAGKYTAYYLHYNTWAGTTGHLMLLIMVLMYTSAHASMRQQSFETFWYTHHLAFFFMLCLYLHANGCFVSTDETKGPKICKGYFSWEWTIWGGIIYFFERVLREVRSRQSTRITKVIAHPSRAIEIQFEKPSFSYKAGQYLFLNVPDISSFQWHPFTITSAPDDPYVSLHIRQVGDFTNKLGEILGCQEASSADNKFDFKKALPLIRVDGSYGTPAEDVFNNEIAILIGCGIGVTPFASILKNIFYQHKFKRPSKLKRVEFFWICRETGSFEWFQSLLKTLEDSQLEEGFLKVHIYLTSKLRESTIQNIIINDVSSSYDPLTDLESRTCYGRPNFNYIFSQLKKAIETGRYLPGKESSLTTNVGVYYCGPTPLAKSLKAECKLANDDGINFRFRKEHF